MLSKCLNESTLTQMILYLNPATTTGEEALNYCVPSQTTEQLTTPKTCEVMD